MTWLRRVVLAMGLAMLAGCESDAAKLERLELAASMAWLDVLRYERRLEESPNSVALRDSLRAARTQQTLAERDLQRFLR